MTKFEKWDKEFENKILVHLIIISVDCFGLKLGQFVVVSSSNSF